MTRIIIDRVENPQDLYNALAAVADVFTPSMSPTRSTSLEGPAGRL